MTINDPAAAPQGPARPHTWTGPSGRPATLPGLRDLAGLWPPPAAREDSGALLRQVLDALGLGLLLVDARCRVAHANTAAQWLCHGGSGLRLQQGRLAGEDGDAARLGAAVRAAAAGQWGMLVLGHGPAVLTVGVVPLQADAAAPEVVAMLVIGREPRPSRLALHFFARAHQLTGAEATVLESLCAGLSPRQIAAQGGVAISTVRTQIAAVRAKVRAASIRDLLRLVSALPPLQGAATGTPS